MAEETGNSEPIKDTGLFCPHCGFNLTALTSNTCPECGKTFILAKPCEPAGPLKSFRLGPSGSMICRNCGINNLEFMPAQCYNCGHGFTLWQRIFGTRPSSEKGPQQ